MMMVHVAAVHAALRVVDVLVVAPVLHQAAGAAEPAAEPQDSAALTQEPVLLSQDSVVLSRDLAVLLPQDLVVLLRDPVVLLRDPAVLPHMLEQVRRRTHKETMWWMQKKAVR